MKRILITGGAGYIGSALIPLLLNAGYDVRLLDVFLYGKQSVHKFRHRIEIIESDYRDFWKLKSAMENVDTVVHLAAIVGDQACDIDDRLTLDVNYYSAVEMAKLAKREGIKRFIFSSTCSVYGASNDILSERSPLNPVSLYARSKIYAEKDLLNLADKKFVVAIPRFGTIYGLSGRSRFDLVINLLTAKAVTHGKITVFGGEQWRPFVHVEDAARGILAMAQAHKANVQRQVFNVGSNEQNYTINEAAAIIHGIVPEAKIIMQSIDGDRRDYRVNFDKIKTRLQFEQQWTVERGVKQVLRAIESGEVVNYNEPEYSNIKYLRDCNAIERLQNFLRKKAI